jgi:hypothetical protein
MKASYFVSYFVLILAKCSLLGAGVLLVTNQFVPAKMHSYLSSLPLALAGAGYTLLQVHLKPARAIFLKRLVLAAAFVLWAIVQLLAPGRLALFLGDAVIAAYVLDLFWMMQDQGLQRLREENRADQDQARMNIQQELPRV